MSTIQIFSDSTCDLSAEQIEKYNIHVIPLNIVLDDRSYFDKEEITRDEIYEWADRNKTIPKTAAPAIDMVCDRMRPYIEAGDDIIYIGISEAMSTTCNVIRLVAGELETDHIHVVDSMNLSTGVGLQLIRAAQMVAEGMSVTEIVENISALRSEVRASFVVDTLTYLARGGRCTATTALLGNTLKIHPRIEVKDGKMGVSTKYRGNLKAVTLKYVKDMEESLLNCRHDIVFITHSGTEPEIVAAVREYLESLGVFKEIAETDAGGVIACHCGWGTLGVLFYMK